MIKKKSPPIKRKPKPVVPTVIPVHDPHGHQALTDMMVHNERHEKARALDGQHSLEQGKRIHDTLDQTLEHSARIHKSIKDNGASIDDMHEGLSDKLDEVSDKLVDAVKPPDIQKVSIVFPENENEDEEETESPAESDEEKNISKLFLRMLRGKPGPKGDKGDRHSDEEITAIIEPLVEKVAESIRPQEEDIISLIESVMPEIYDGKDGTDGETPSEEYLKELIQDVMPQINLPTIDEIIAQLKGKIKYDDIKDKPNLDTFRGKGLGGTGYLREISDVDASKIQDGQVLIWNKKANKWIPGTISSGGGSGYTYREIPSGAIDGSNTAFTLANVPTQPDFILVNLGGAILDPLNGDYTISSNTITLSSAPVSPATISVMYS